MLNQQTEPFVIQRVERQLARFQLFPKRCREALKGWEVVRTVGDTMICEECRERCSLRRCEVRERVSRSNKTNSNGERVLVEASGDTIVSYRRSRVLAVVGVAVGTSAAQAPSTSRNDCSNTPDSNSILGDSTNLKFSGPLGGGSAPRV